MDRKSKMDMAGATGMVIFSGILAFNQVVIKVTNLGFGPVFGAGLRSALALCVLGIWLLATGRRLGDLRGTLGSGVLLGSLFATEFILLFLALDMTSVSRASVVFYSMPVWLAIVAHVMLPGERLNGSRIIGLALAMIGVAWALADPQSRTGGQFIGDVLAVLAAWCWAGIALTVRLTGVTRLPAEGQLFWQLAVSAVIMCAVSPLFGPLLRDPEALHWLAMGYGVIVASLGFMFWLRLMAIYPASDIAAFSFLSPVLAVGFGWLLLDEPVGPQFLLALALVCLGVVLINRRPKSA